MPIFYLDTSAILKRYRREIGTEAIDDLIGNAQPEDRFYTSILSTLELTSALMRLVKGGQLGGSVAEAASAAFRQDIQEIFRVWPLDDSTVATAIPVVEQHKLRSIDAIHLATAIAIFAAAGDENTILVSSDMELLEAAASSGIDVLNPQDN